MIADLSRVASTIREDSLTARLTSLRAVILKELREKGFFKIRDGEQEFTITIKGSRAAAGSTPHK
jgi:hypothetical protein